MDIYTMLKKLQPRNISQNFYDYRYYERLIDNRKDVVNQTLNFVENLMVKIENDIKSRKEKTSESLKIPNGFEFQLKELDNAKPDMATVLRNIDNLMAYLSSGTIISNDVPDNEMKRNVVLSHHEKLAAALRNIDNLMDYLSIDTVIPNDVPENGRKRNVVLSDHAKPDKDTVIRLNTDYNIGYQVDEQKNNYKMKVDKTIQTSSTSDNNKFVSLQSMEKILKLLCLLKSNINELDEKFRSRISLGYTYTESDHIDMKLRLQSLENDVMQLKCTFDNVRGTYFEIEKIVTQYNKYESEYRNLRSIFKRGKLVCSRVSDEKKETFNFCRMIKSNLCDPCCNIYKTWFS